MKKIKFFLEYHCFPLWVYDENNDLIVNDMPEELKNNLVLDKKLVEIQKKYDTLFTDNNIEFSYNGFKKETDKKEFSTEIKKVLVEINSLVGNKYIIDDCTSF